MAEPARQVRRFGRASAPSRGPRRTRRATPFVSTLECLPGVAIFAAAQALGQACHRPESISQDQDLRDRPQDATGYGVVLSRDGAALKEMCFRRWGVSMAFRTTALRPRSASKRTSVFDPRTTCRLREGARFTTRRNVAPPAEPWTIRQRRSPVSEPAGGSKAHPRPHQALPHRKQRPNVPLLVRPPMRRTIRSEPARLRQSLRAPLVRFHSPTPLCVHRSVVPGFDILIVSGDDGLLDRRGVLDRSGRLRKQPRRYPRARATGPPPRPAAARGAPGSRRFLQGQGWDGRHLGVLADARGLAKDSPWVFPAPTKGCETCERPGHAGGSHLRPPHRLR